MENLFLPSLEGVAEVMKEQLRLAREKGAREKGCDVKVASTPYSRYQAHLILRKLYLWAASDNPNPCALT